MHEIPSRLENILLSYVKKTYLPERRNNPRTANLFTNHDIDFFASGVAEMSAYFTSERSHLPKNYLNKKELRAGYILYFVMGNLPKVLFCLEEIDAASRFKNNKVIKIADLGCGPGTASLACLEYWKKNSPHKALEFTAIDQNINALHDVKGIFKELGSSIKTVYSNLHPKNISSVLKDRFDIVIAANFLSEVGNVERQAEISESILQNHLTDNGIFIIIEPALRWTTRNLMRLRDTILNNRQTLTANRIISPCLHTNPCPMLAHNNRDWCHMYINWRRPDVIAKIDRLIGNYKDYIKFSHLVIANEVKQSSLYNLVHGIASPAGGGLAMTPVFRVVSSPMRSKGKIELLLCNERGLLHVTRPDKNASPQNSDFDNVKRGDLVSFCGSQLIEKITEFKILNRRF